MIEYIFVGFMLISFMLGFICAKIWILGMQIIAREKQLQGEKK